MTDGPASSAGSDTSSLPSPETASDEIQPDLDFTFRRGQEKLVISGTKPFVLLTLTDTGVSITGGGMPADVPQEVIAEFLLAAADTMHSMGVTLTEQVITDGK